jgi:hypothetical protein
MATDWLRQEEMVQIELSCGHPNQNDGEKCEHCGVVIPTKAKAPEDSENGRVQEVR